ncbi:MAG: PAS domain-containing protein, partial [Thermodesulfobacteriota bacterium]
MKNTQNDTGKTHSSEGPDIFTDPAQIRRQAEEKAKTRPLPSPESMTREQIRQTFYEMQVRQIETELKNQQLCKGLELYADHAELLTAITENILDLVALTDLEGNLGFVGKSHEIFGYERQSMTGQNVMDYVHPDDLPRVLEAFKELVASGDPPRTEYRFRCRDGAYLWIETRGTLLKDENGHPRKILFSSRDISQRKQAEEAIEKERSYLSAVIDSIGEAIVICDAEGRISRFNETARQLHGLPEQPVLPEQWAEHYDLKWVELFAFPIKQEGNDKITGIVEYVRDITARRQAEKEREKLQVQLYQAQKM